jgi:hypothetical protein
MAGKLSSSRRRLFQLSVERDSRLDSLTHSDSLHIDHRSWHSYELLLSQGNTRWCNICRATPPWGIYRVSTRVSIYVQSTGSPVTSCSTSALTVLRAINTTNASLVIVCHIVSSVTRTWEPTTSQITDPPTGLSAAARQNIVIVIVVLRIPLIKPCILWVPEHARKCTFLTIQGRYAIHYTRISCQTAWTDSAPIALMEFRVMPYVRRAGEVT